MTRILFRGGDKDGQNLETSDVFKDASLVFDGRGGIASPRGKYGKTAETVTTGGVEWEIWDLISTEE